MARQKKQTLSQRVEIQVMAEEPEAAKPLSAKVEKVRTRNKSYLIDLRIHSPASLGYVNLDGIDTAPALVRLAKVKGLDVIAVTDYYSVGYLERVLAAAENSSVIVIPGVVIRCRVGECDDVVLSCLFPESAGTQSVRELMAALKVPAHARGRYDYVVSLSLEEILTAIEGAGGIAVPSRMDKTPHRKAMIKVLVEKYGFRAFDLAYYPESVQYFKSNWPKIKFQLFNFSSATALAQVGNRHSRVKMPLPGFEGIKTLACRQLGSLGM